MKLKYVLILVLLASFITSCKSKKSVVKSQPKRSYHKVDKAITVKQIERNNKVNPTIFNSTEEYINYFKDAAIEEMKIYKIPASITLAQGILESSSGKSALTIKSNNHFGIKCHKGWEGGKTYHDDDEKGECFRVYEDPAVSYRDHSLFLTTRSRYANLFKLDSGDYIGWATGLSEAGYATDRRYPAKLIGLIEKFDLHKYDTKVLGKEYKVENNRKSNTESHVVNKGDTLYSISKRYGLSVDELKRLNGLDSNNISIGQSLNVSNF